jgi:hypothetical protein
MYQGRLVEIHCRQCGKSLGMFPYQGFSTVTQCVYCVEGDGFSPPEEWPVEDPFFGRDVGTTQQDWLQKGDEQPAEDGVKLKNTWKKRRVE